jgi:DNA-binding beta-propeller fold protein YncE
MKRLILVVMLGLLTASLAFAGQTSLTKMILPMGKSMEGGIAVNPVTHKAYVIAELAAEGADDEKVIFVFDNDSLNAKNAPKKLGLPLATTHPVKVIPILNENEYIAIDSIRNLVYVGTKFSVEQDESDTGDDEGGGGDVEPPGGEEPPELAPVTSLEPVPVILGTLTVIDGNTDTVIDTWYFSPGIEPEGVAVDPATGVVYLGAKAPEGEAADDLTCTSGTPIPDIAEPGDVECWTGGYIYAFFADPAGERIITWLKTIPAGDDPESVVFVSGKVYAANEDDGTVTIASAVTRCETGWCGGDLLTDPPAPLVSYSLHVFSYANTLACIENQFEADKMAAGGGSVFITDDRSRVAKITGTAVVSTVEVPGATVCEAIPNTDGGGLNTSNNIAFMQRGDRQLLYVASEQNTVAIFNPATMTQKATITIPGAQHIDGIAVDAAANRVWLTDEDVQAVFVLQGACANGTGACIP